MPTLFALHLCRSKKNSIIIRADLETIEGEVLPDSALVATEHKSAIEVHCAIDSFADLLPTGALGLLLSFADKLNYFNEFETHFHGPMKTVDYTPTEKLLTLICSLAVGCDSIKDINHKLRPYPAAARLLGLERFPDQSQVHRLFHQLEPRHASEIELVFECLLRQFGLWQAVDRVDLDIDSTGLMVYGSTYEFSRKGYFPRQRGRRGYRVTLAYSSKAAGNEILGLFLDPANSSAGARFWDCIYQTADILGSFDRLGLIRSDAANGSGPDIEGLIELGLDFLIKGYSTKTAQALAAELKPCDWQPVDLFTRVADLGLRPISSCRHPVRVILVELMTHRRDKSIYSHIYTSLSPQQADAEAVFESYNGRETIEAMIKAGKNGLHIKHLRTRRYAGIQAFLYIVAITFNLIALFRGTVLKGTELQDLGLFEITNKLMDIPAKCNFVGNQLELKFPANHPYANGLIQLN